MSGAAKRQLAALPEPVYVRVKPVLMTLRQNPRPRGCKKLTGAQTKYRLRVGDYRILYEVLDSEKIVRVYRIRHRSDAY